MKIANLSMLKPNKDALIVKIGNGKVDKEFTKHLQEIGMYKGAPIRITDKVRKDSFIVKVGQTSMSIDKRVIDRVQVSANDEFIMTAKEAAAKKSVFTRLVEWFKGFSE